MTPESQIQNKIIKFLENEWYTCVKLIKTNLNGVPDLLVLKWDETCFFVEVKTETGRLSKLQSFRIKKFEENNYKVFVPKGYDDFVKKYANYIDK